MKVRPGKGTPTEADRLWAEIQRARRGLLQAGWAHALCLRFYNESNAVVELLFGSGADQITMDGKDITEGRARTFITLLIAAQHSKAVKTKTKPKPAAEADKKPDKPEADA